MREAAAFCMIESKTLSSSPSLLGTPPSCTSNNPSTRRFRSSLLARFASSQLSTAIAGPNENLKSREATGSDEVISREVIKEYVDIFQTPEIPRGVRRTTLYLVTSIYHCENLPFSNDSPSFLSSANAMDVEVIVEVGTKKMHSQVVRIEENKDEDSGKATFNVEIWLVRLGKERSNS